MIAAAAQSQHHQGFLLHRHQRMAEAEPFYRRAIEIDPDFKEAWMNLGLVALSQRRFDEALLCQREALRLDPDNADAQNNLGMAHYMLGHIGEAEICFRSALRLRPDHPNATMNLGSARQTLNHIGEAEALYRRAIEMGADSARARSNLALALLEQARPEEAELLLRQTVADHPDFPEARANHALALLTMGQLEEGWQAYESRWAVETMGGNAPVIPVPRWTGQPLNGETVLLHAEQGFGDVLQFSRYVPMVAAAGGRVVLLVPKALRGMMATLAGVSELVTEEDNAVPAFDYHCPLLSLPYAFATRMTSIPAPIPYLKGTRAPWDDFLGGLKGRKVGLVWAGKSRTAQPHAVAIDKRRSMRLTDFLPLLAVPGCDFVSLQLGPAAAQMQALPEGLVLHDVSVRLADWSDTAGLLQGLDLVIAVDTAVAHLAGALGRPVWLLNRFDSCWRWFQRREDTPWYPTMRLFRQTRPGDWAEVVERVKLALQGQVAA